MKITKLNESNLKIWLELRKQLWSNTSEAIHIMDGKKIILSNKLVSFIALNNNNVGIGFADASIRHDYTNGCITSPVAFLEGIFVIPSYRMQGISKEMINKVQAWSIEKNCKELASDTSLNNIISQKMLISLGFQETEKVVFFKKELT